MDITWGYNKNIFFFRKTLLNEIDHIKSSCNQGIRFTWSPHAIPLGFLIESREITLREHVKTAPDKLHWDIRTKTNVRDAFLGYPLQPLFGSLERFRHLHLLLMSVLMELPPHLYRLESHLFLERFATRISPRQKAKGGLISRILLCNLKNVLRASKESERCEKWP